MDDIQLNLIHDENIYIKYFDINTMCVMFDYRKYKVKIFFFFLIVMSTFKF